MTGKDTLMLYQLPSRSSGISHLTEWLQYVLTVHTERFCLHQ